MNSISFSKFLKGISNTSLPLLDVDIPKSKYIPLSLSKNNKQLQGINLSSSKDLAQFITSHISNNKGLVAYGGYNEKRSIYERSKHFNNRESTERNIHLGIDLWCAKDSLIFSPLNGIVHSFKNNTNYGDYGPTIILKHTLKENEFYTLYGHLSIDSIESLKVGQTIRQGECFAKLGNSSVNGDYPPHLHFQIIKDMQDYQGDYPGVCNEKDLDFYLSNCPDPNLILKL